MIFVAVEPVGPVCKLRSSFPQANRQSPFSFELFSSFFLLAVFQAVTFSIHLKNVNMVSNPIQ